MAFMKRIKRLEERVDVLQHDLEQGYTSLQGWISQVEYELRARVDALPDTTTVSPAVDTYHRSGTKEDATSYSSPNAHPQSDSEDEAWGYTLAPDADDVGHVDDAAPRQVDNATLRTKADETSYSRRTDATLDRAVKLLRAAHLGVLLPTTLDEKIADFLEEYYDAD